MLRKDYEPFDRKPRIAQFIDSMDPGGAEEILLNLASGFVEDGYPVTIFHFGNQWLVRRLEHAGLDHVILNARFYKSSLMLPLFILTFGRILKHRKVDVLHAHLLGAIFAGALAARLCGMSSIGTIHDTYSLYEARLHTRYLAWAHKVGCQLVVVAESMREEVAELCSLKVDAIKRIYNGISLVQVRPIASSDSQDDTVRLVTVARAVAIKRIDLLLEAIAAIETDVPFQLNVVGDGPELPELKEIARALNLNKRVRFLGHQSAVASILTDSDIFVLVSDSEGLSVSLLESMAAGLPSVVTDVGGNSELVEDGESGFVVPAGDVAAIVGRLNLLIADRARRTRFGTAALARARNKFSMKAMQENYTKIVQEKVGTCV